MKRYLVLGHYLKGDYQTDEISREDLGAIKNRDCDFLIDIQNGTIFNPKDNEWIKIPEKI